jgi:hypothetical protein
VTVVGWTKEVGNCTGCLIIFSFTARDMFQFTLKNIIAAVGFFMVILTTISLPWLNGQGVFNINAASVSYATPINGTLNVDFPFYNLTQIRVSLAAFLLPI